MMESLRGTAGAPMLNILQKFNLVNVLAVTTRYFGGILLGTGGLVRCYSESLQKAIDKADKIQMCDGMQICLMIDYNQYEQFKYYCKQNNILIKDVEYGECIICRIELEIVKKERLLNDIEMKSCIIKEIKDITSKFIVKI